MSQPLTCPHSSIGLCVPCYHERIAAGVEMPEQDNRLDYTTCICGRRMTLVLASKDDENTDVHWCAGCGVLHIHRQEFMGDSRYIPDPQFIGRK